MPTPAWDIFFENAVKAALAPDSRVLDIGAGLRADPSRGNRVDARRAWIRPLLERVRYDVLDPVDTYKPDIVGDLQAMPIDDAFYDSVICLAVLEHVSRPWDGVKEMRRILKPGGFLFLYVPFLAPYHAEPGYYSDFWRFTDEGIKTLLYEFDDVRLVPVRGPVETLAHLLPRPIHNAFFLWLGRKLDSLRRASGKQASGFYVTARRPAA
ncbi:MAG: class I SAM-dependent methyltransferase [Patescibacteria group bacterium]